MGNSNDGHFVERGWVFQRRNNNYDIYRDGKDLYAEKHLLPNNPKIQQDDEMEIYVYRNTTDKPIVRVYDANYIKSDSACGADRNIEVYSEYIPYRLSDTRNLNHGQALYVLSQALAGFHELHYRFGPFAITDDHIGFNDQGETRVWHSPNFATNHLQHDGIVLMSTLNPKNFDERMERRQEEQMVEDVWLAVEDHSCIDQNFKLKVNSFRELGFYEARNLIAEQITRGTCYVPEYLNFQQSNRYSGQYIDERGRNIHQVQSRHIHQNAPDNYQHQQGSHYRHSQYRESRPVESVVQPAYQNSQYSHHSNSRHSNSPAY